MPKVIQLPDHLLCEHCGYALHADEPYQHGTSHHVMYCKTNRCRSYRKRLLIPFTILNVRLAPDQPDFATSPAQAESDHGPPERHLDP